MYMDKPLPNGGLSALEAATAFIKLAGVTSANVHFTNSVLKDMRDKLDEDIMASLLTNEPLTNKNAPISLGDVQTTTNPMTGGRMATVKQNSWMMDNPRTGRKEPQFIDVELHGVMVPLLALKNALKQNKGVTQGDLSSRTAAHTPDGKAYHQTSVSNYLIGKQEMTVPMLNLLETIFDASEAAALASSNPMASAPPTAASTAPRARPGFAASMAAANGAPPAPVTTKTDPVTGATTVVLPALRTFPEERAYDLMKGVRLAEGKGEITATFSLRKAILWGRAYYLLQQEGFSEQEALSGAFHLAVEGKTYGEDQTFLKNLFQAKFAFESKPPMSQKTALQDGRHPMSYLIEPLLREGLHIWVHGPTGAGKTHSLYDIATILGRQVIRFQGKGDATTDDFVGGFGLVERNGVAVTEFQYGPLPKAMMEGAILNVDEITALPAEVLFELQAVLEGKPLVLTKNRGEVIHPAPGFVVAAADNSLGLGEATSYTGLNVMNEAFRDRFYFVHYGYMPEAMEKKALRSELATFFGSRGWTA